MFAAPLARVGIGSKENHMEHRVIVEVVPTHEKRLADEITRLYGPTASLRRVSQTWAAERRV